MNSINSSLKSKLLAFFLLGIGIIAIIILVGFSRAWMSIDGFQSVVDTEVANERTVNGMTIAFKKQVQEWKNVLLRGKDPKQLDKYWGRFQKTEQSIQADGRELLSYLEPGEAYDLVNQFMEAHQTMGVAYRKGYDAFVAADFLHTAGDKAVAGIDRAPTKLLEDAANLISEQAKVASEASIANGKSSILISTVLAAVVLVVFILATLWFANTQIVRPARRMKAYLENLATGDFSQQIDCDTEDEFGDIAKSAQIVQENLGSMVRDLKRLSEGLNESASQLSVMVTNNADTILHQKDETAHLSTSMSEMTKAVQDIAKNAHHTAERTRLSDEYSVKGDAIVNDLIDEMRSLANEINTSNDLVQSVEVETNQIGNVMDVITGIAEQTNLLALNAAIEAARAGEQGRGFAVVADEVRTLASRTQESTAEIRNVIERLQSATRSASEAMQKGAENSNTTMEMAQRAGEALRDIKQSVSEITTANIEIASAAEEQSSVSEQVDQNVARINEFAQTVYDLGQQSETAVQNVVNSSAEMKTQAQRFTV